MWHASHETPGATPRGAFQRFDQAKRHYQNAATPEEILALIERIEALEKVAEAADAYAKFASVEGSKERHAAHRQLILSIAELNKVTK